MRVLKTNINMAYQQYAILLPIKEERYMCVAFEGVCACCEDDLNYAIGELAEITAEDLALGLGSGRAFDDKFIDYDMRNSSLYGSYLFEYWCKAEGIILEGIK